MEKTQITRALRYEFEKRRLARRSRVERYSRMLADGFERHRYAKFVESEHPRDEDGKFVDTGGENTKRVPMVRRGSLTLHPVRVTRNADSQPEVHIDDNTRQVTINAPRSWDTQDLKILLMRSIDKHFSPLPEGHFVRVTHYKEDYDHLKNGTHRGSKNHATGQSEGGLSVAHKPETSAKYSYIVSGKEIGQGADGEPLLDVSTAKPESKLMASSKFGDWWIDSKAKKLKELGWTWEEYGQLASSFILLESDKYDNEVSSAS